MDRFPFCLLSGCLVRRRYRGFVTAIATCPRKAGADHVIYQLKKMTASSGRKAPKVNVGLGRGMTHAGKAAVRLLSPY